MAQSQLSCAQVTRREREKGATPHILWGIVSLYSQEGGCERSNFKIHALGALALAHTRSLPLSFVSDLYTAPSLSLSVTNVKCSFVFPLLPRAYLYFAHQTLVDFTVYQTLNLSKLLSHSSRVLPRPPASWRGASRREICRARMTTATRWVCQHIHG